MRTVHALTLAVLFAGLAVAAEPTAPDYTFSGPYTHANLTIFLVHGKDTVNTKKLVTLAEALQQKKLIVHETKNVNELVVENVADDVDVFIQAGDIVKGGQQDRALNYDLIVSARSGKVPAPVFCVEAGRWRQRGAENAAQFDGSYANATGNAFKKAICLSGRQDEVWQRVRETQAKLEKNLGQSVQGKEAPTSLQITLENQKLVETMETYTKELAKITDGKKDVLGYVVAVNGKVAGADIYGAAVLFEKVWPRLLRGCVVDALAELEKGKQVTAPTADAVRTFLSEADQGKATTRNLSNRVQINTREATRNVVIECQDKNNGGQVLRRNYIAK